MKIKDKLPKVLFRYCNDMEHIIVYRDSLLLSDAYEGFPKLSGK